ncbi:MAG TPA: hypothetical protein VE570_13200 [Thermoleophilaceae bacterium]|nr:hypothetical protein [Thermoleophilaceae bacterium]
MRPRALFGGVVAGALVLRLIAVGDTLSHDEGYTWLVASSGGPGVFLDRLAAFENTPPLYYLLTWPLPDVGVAWLRIVSVLAGVGCVAAVAWITRSTSPTHRVARVPRGTPWVAAGALAVAPFAVSYSDYARGFILADLGLLVALGAAMRRNWWLHALGAAVALYAEYDSALFLIALACAVGWRRRADGIRALAPLLLLIPWIPEIVRAADATGDTKASPIYPDPSVATLRDTIVRLTFGEHGTADAVSLRWVQFLVVAAVCVWAFRRAPRMLSVVALGTLALHALAHLIGPDVFAPRYLTELIPLAAIAVGMAATTRRLQIAAAVGIVALGIVVGVKRTDGAGEPDYKGVAQLIAPGAKGRTVVTNSAVVAYYLRDLRARLDRPFGLGPGLESGCVGPCKASFLVVDDTRVANSPRIGPGRAHAFGALYVRATPQEGRDAAVHHQGDMSSLACTIALLVAQGMGGIGTSHPLEVTVQDDALFLHQPPASVQRTARRLAALGADRLRVTAGWSALAPSPRDPKRPSGFDATRPDQYQPVAFRALDTAVKSATAAGMKVQIDLGFWAPRWAVARGLARSSRQRWRPSAAEFAQFADAVAKRYDGNFPDPTSKKGNPLPAVRLWTTWNEPNHPSFLLPQSERTRGGRWRDVAPHVYRAMHEAAYNSLKRVDQQNQVLIGGLSSRGASRPGPERNIPPLRFVRDLACVDQNLQPLNDPACRDFHPLQADGFAYHPYSFEAAPNVVYGGPDTAHLGDLGRLTDLLHQLHDKGRITTALPLYLTEFGYESNPPDTGRGVPPETQARYMSLGSFLAWRNPDTRMFAQFLFQDIADPSSYQTGLLYPDGRSKPALQAFKLPLWAEAQEKNGQAYVLVWGQVRPGSGAQSVALEAQRPDGTWHTIPSMTGTPQPDGRNCPTEDKQFLTDENGFYLRLLPYQGVLAYRARWMRSDGGTDYAPPITVGAPSAG